ncbi:MAG: hypothetical protein EBR09_17005 [Proteobacteria bacterium]|jgi:hypothetical protein|nr:hypothetical protein [Pseudomonadota bacterium]
MALSAQHLDSKLFEIARVAQALERYEKAADEQREVGPGSRAFIEQTTGAALHMRSKVLLAELEHVRKSHATEIEELRRKHTAAVAELRMQMRGVTRAFNVAQMHQAKSPLRGLRLEPLDEEHLRGLKLQLEQSLEAVSRAHSEQETSVPRALRVDVGAAGPR